jgi:hypothetical protein
MAAGTTFANDLLKLLFHGTAIADLADNDATGPLTSLYLSLHTADPKAGNQSTSETTYTGYARIAIDRDADGWTITGASATNAATNSFAKNTNGTETLTHVGLGTASSGAGKVILANPLDEELDLVVGATPLFEAGQLTFTAA